MSVSSSNQRLLTPPKEPEIYPYRQVWRSIIVELGLLLSFTIILFIVSNLLNLSIPSNLHSIVNIFLALLPAFLWYVFSFLSERRVPQPRQQLGAVFVVTLLLAGSLGLQVVENVIQPERWLALMSAYNRIIGYTLTIGIFQEFLKYLVIRLLVWPNHFRIRSDSIAYGATTAVAYGTLLNLYLALTTPVLPDAFANRAFSQIAIQLAGSIVLAYGLSETKFTKSSIFLLPITLLLSAFVTGIAIPLRSGLINASLPLPNETGLLIGATRPLLGLGLSVVVVISSAIVIAFLLSNADRRMRDSQAE